MLASDGLAAHLTSRAEARRDRGCREMTSPAIHCAPFPMSDTGRVRLASWKEIAAYLHREVRTVIRWEKERGLPVHRVPGGAGGSVFAFSDELDRWAAGDTGREAQAAKPPERRRLALSVPIAAVAVVALLAAGIVLARPRPVLDSLQLLDTAVSAVDRTGRQIWTFDVPGRIERMTRRQVDLIDLNGDGARDGIVSIALNDFSTGTSTGPLYALSDRGALLWQRQIDTKLSFGAGDFDAPWVPDDVLAFTNGGEPFVAWSVHHLTWWPSMLAVFNGHGDRVGTFVQSGWIRFARATADGRHLITGGFSNSRKGAAFAVLDARNPDGSSPEDAGSAFECRNCPPGRPLRYFVVDWSDIATVLPPDERETAVSVSPERGTITLRAIQRHTVDLIVELSPDFQMTRRSVSDAFWEWHRRLEQNGTLDHGRDRCPYRDGPIVREWTPAAGWRTFGTPAPPQ